MLNQYFYLKVSTKALKTIKKFGGLDNYLLKFNPKILETSQFGKYLKNVLIKKKKDPLYRVGYLPFTSRPRFKWKKRELYEVREMPSIYIPPEAKKTDLSEMYYPTDFFETRLEKKKIKEIEIKLESESDPIKRDELKKELNSGKFIDKVKKDMISLMPYRHQLIRDTFIRIKDRPTAKLHFIKTVESSENYTKLILGEEYKHYSEDYPEIQLILQKIEEDKIKKNKLIGKIYREYSYDFGEAYEDGQVVNAKTFNPFDDKQGKVREAPQRRINNKMTEKLNERSLKKEKELFLKNKEKKSIDLKTKLKKKRDSKKENRENKLN
jgi:hypothetical protein